MSWQMIRRSATIPNNRKTREEQTNKQKLRQKKKRNRTQTASSHFIRHSKHRLVAASSEWMQFVYLQKRYHHVTCGEKKRKSLFFVFMFRRLRNTLKARCRICTYGAKVSLLNECMRNASGHKWMHRKYVTHQLERRIFIYAYSMAVLVSFNVSIISIFRVVCWNMTKEFAHNTRNGQTNWTLL